MTPLLLIIGGPNGAGKSTFSKNFSRDGALIYDADLVTALVKSENPAWPNKSVVFAVEQH